MAMRAALGILQGRLARAEFGISLSMLPLGVAIALARSLSHKLWVKRGHLQPGVS
jgi:hydrogenase/urease accessory protein HupE